MGLLEYNSACEECGCSSTDTKCQQLQAQLLHIANMSFAGPHDARMFLLILQPIELTALGEPSGGYTENRK